MYTKYLSTECTKHPHIRLKMINELKETEYVMPKYIYKEMLGKVDESRMISIVHEIKQDVIENAEIPIIDRVMSKKALVAKYSDTDTSVIVHKVSLEEVEHAESNPDLPVEHRGITTKLEVKVADNNSGISSVDKILPKVGSETLRLPIPCKMFSMDKNAECLALLTIHASEQEKQEIENTKSSGTPAVYKIKQDIKDDSASLSLIDHQIMQEKLKGAVLPSTHREKHEYILHSAYSETDASPTFPVFKIKDEVEVTETPACPNEEVIAANLKYVEVDDEYAYFDSCDMIDEASSKNGESQEMMQNLKLHSCYEEMMCQEYYVLYPKAKPTLPIGTMMHFCGVTGNIRREDIKQALEILGANIAFIDFNIGDKEGWVRLSDAYTAKSMLKKMTDSKIKVADTDIVFRVLKRNEEKKYLKKTINLLHKRKNSRNNLSNTLKKCGFKYVKNIY